jgi:acyl carrier protein
MPDTPPPNTTKIDVSDEALEQIVVGIIAKKKKLAPASITRDSTFEMLGIDSLDGIDLVFTFEDEFNISIPDQVVQRMKSVGQAIEALREVLDKRDAPQT